MMNHLPLIIKREYFTKVRNRSFIIMTFVSPLIMIVLVSVVAYLTQLNNDKKRTISILDESGLFTEVFQNTENTTYSYLQPVDLEAAKAIVKESKGYGLMHIEAPDSDETVPSGFKFYSEDSPSLTVMLPSCSLLRPLLWRRSLLSQSGIVVRTTCVVSIVVVLCG